MWQNIDMYIGIVIMTIGVIYFAKIVLDKQFEVSKIELLLIVCIISLFYTILYLNFDGILKTTIICLINVCIFKYLFNETIYQYNIHT